MQVIENLFVVHNLDEQSSQIYDLKSGSLDYNEGLVPSQFKVEAGKSKKGKFLAEFIAKDEKKYKDEGFRMIEVSAEEEGERQETAIDYNLYSETDVLFVEPSFILDLKNNSCLTLRLSLKRYVEAVPSKGRLLMSLVNRGRNKVTLLNVLKA